MALSISTLGMGQATPGAKKAPAKEIPIEETEASQKSAPNATLDPEDLIEFTTQPPRVRELIQAALALTKQNLTYVYGSADPANGGMDCSGTIYHLLRSQGFDDVPRDSPGQYVWVRKHSDFQAVVSTSADSFEFKKLLPGDLLFWSGTYVVEREFPITHVMLYLGREKKTKNRVMVGASDGRSYHGLQRWGVSVFDFKMPSKTVGKIETRQPDFVGYGRIPGLREAAPASVEDDQRKAEEDSKSSRVDAEPKEVPQKKKTPSAAKRKTKPSP